MTELHRLPDVNRVEEEASEWIARLNADTVSAEDRAHFAKWRSAHTLHARTYDAMSVAWRAFHTAGSVVRAVSFGQAMNEVTEPRRGRHRWIITGAAAAAVVVCMLSLYWVQRTPQTRFETGIGEHASVALPDGSSVELNSNTAVRASYSEHSRVIQLQRGEAFFRVTHDTARPFWVVGGGTWVRAVGTAFNVDLRPARVRVTVSEGVVQVGAGESLLTAAPRAKQLTREPVSLLTAGQEVDVQPDATSIRTLAPTEIKRSLAWRSGKVYFEKQPLGAVIEEMGRYTPLKLIVADDKLRGLPVGGTFPATPQGVEMLVSMLQDGFQLQIRREPGRVYIEDAATALSE